MKQEEYDSYLTDQFIHVATVLTVYGIETVDSDVAALVSTTSMLQQYLPLAVLKLFAFATAFVA